MSDPTGFRSGLPFSARFERINNTPRLYANAPGPGLNFPFDTPESSGAAEQTFQNNTSHAEDHEMTGVENPTQVPAAMLDSDDEVSQPTSNLSKRKGPADTSLQGDLAGHDGTQATQSRHARLPNQPNVPANVSYQIDRSIANLTAERVPEILNMRSLQGLDAKPTEAQWVDWTWENRREVQEVLPFLFLGPFTTVRDPKFIQSNNVTMLLAVTTAEGFYSKVLAPAKIVQLNLPGVTVDTLHLEDEEKASHVAVYEGGVNRVNTHLAGVLAEGKTPKVVVYCENGSNRSACFVVAYLVAMYGLSVSDALGFVQHRRFSTAIDREFNTQLEAFELILQARADVESAGRKVKWPPMPLSDVFDNGFEMYKGQAMAEEAALPPKEKWSFSGLHKRNHSLTYQQYAKDDDKMTDSDGDDSYQTDGRAGQAPFYA